jgi:two-component system, sensor histidine kinase
MKKELIDEQKFREEQELILKQIDNAIALFDDSHHLILFNEKLAHTWGVSPDWLESHPHEDELLREIIAQGYWSEVDGREFKSALQQVEISHNSFYIEQTNGVCLEIELTVTPRGDRLFIFRDVTSHHKAQKKLNAEVKRLRFLLGLNEHLQDSNTVKEIGHFALEYLVNAMNAAFGDVKVISGEGKNRLAGTLTNEVSSQFIATYGEPVIAEMQELLNQGIPYGKGLLWQVVETGEPIFVEDYSNHPQAVTGFCHPGISQLAIFPIPAPDGRIIGVLTLESRDLKQLKTGPHEDVLSAACRTLGIAIERAQSQEQLRKINQELERSSQLKSEFLASMSHELRTPLNSILGFSDLLLRQVSGTLSERQINYIQLIEKSGQHLLQLINDILDLSKIEAGKVDLNLAPINVQILATDCMTMMQPRADKKRINLSLKFDERVSTVLLDERRVRQIIINLLSNAVKFTPEGGYVKLTGRLAYGNEINGSYRPDCSPINASTPYLCIEVEDSGIGVPEDRWHLLFRPFQQVDSSLTRRHEGTGLGLALTKRLAELHGGTVSFQSVCDRGSTFRVWLPLTEMRQELYQQTLTPMTTTEILVSPSNSTGMKRVLVVEDQPFNQMLITEVLELEGYAVELIADGQTMWDCIHSPIVQKSVLPDLILMDIQLPDIDGFKLMEALKKHPLWQSVPIIAVTAMAMSGDRDRCLAAGADAYLSKPLNITDAIAIVQSVITSSKVN